MNVTRLGKTLIFVNLGLSILFLGWAVGIYTQRLPWAPMTIDGEQVKGRVAELREQIQRLEAARDTADTRWNAATAQLIKLEIERPTRQNYYAEQMKIMTTGADNRNQRIEPALQQLDMANGVVQMKKTGRPAVQIDGKNALSVKGYTDTIDRQLKEHLDEQKKINGLVDEAKRLTLVINGTKPPAEAITAEEKGLRGQLADQQWLKRSLQLEEQYLLTPLTNYQVETELLKKRQAALQERLKELNSSPME